MKAEEDNKYFVGLQSWLASNCNKEPTFVVGKLTMKHIQDWMGELKKSENDKLTEKATKIDQSRYDKRRRNT
jgi:hypothetical protein